MIVAIAAGAIIGLVLRILRTVEQTIKLLTIVLSIYEFPWENLLAVLEVLILVCTSALPCGTLSTCSSEIPILGSGHVWLYPLDTVPTKRYSYCRSHISAIVTSFLAIPRGRMYEIKGLRFQGWRILRHQLPEEAFPASHQSVFRINGLQGL